MNIRPASSDDTPTLIFLRDERHVLLQQAAPYLREYPARLDFSIILSRPDVGVFVASDGAEDRVVGYIAASSAPLDQPSALPDAPNAGVLLELALDAHRYHAGMGRALYRTAAGWLKEQGRTVCLIRVPRYHVVEQAFWRSLGAVEVRNVPEENRLPGWDWMKLLL